MKPKANAFSHIFTICALFFCIFAFSPATAQAAEATTTLSVDRASGKSTYTIKGLEPETTSSFSLIIERKSDNKEVLNKEISLTSANCTDGSYTGEITLESLNYDYSLFTAKVKIGEQTLTLGEMDYTIHDTHFSLAVNGTSSALSRTINIGTTDSSDTILIPGAGKSVYVAVWPEGANESTASIITEKTTYTEGGMTLTASLASTPNINGTWNAKLVFEAANGSTKTLATATYSTLPTFSSLQTTKTAALEKKQKFGISLSGLQNVYGVSKVKFRLYNSKGTKVAAITATSKKSGKLYYAEVTLKKLKYTFDNYTIKTTITDAKGKSFLLGTDAVASIVPHGGSLSVTKKSNAKCVYKLKNAYIPGNIKKLQFVLYKINGSKSKKQGTYEMKPAAGKKTISFTVANEDKGKFKLVVYGYTSWGKKIYMNEETYRLRKKDLGKNGWFYEKYAGKKYKFYYVNNVKQTDLTKILGLEKSSSTNTNKLYVEINRAACTVTIYLYNEETNKYDIPVKTCSVSVGADTWTNAGTSGLHEQSSYTPLGTYSICTNGQSVKYTLKPMHEPDGSTVYARWTTHIVGNVYFHSIAVGAQSHYALPASTYNRLGSPASAGCIRMTVADAKWIYDYTSTGNTVKINKGNAKKPGPLGKSPTITSNVNYDPTDPAVPDSRKKADYKAKRISGYMTKKGVKVGY
ncbi:MAG: L,D-transpeptidase [Clostridiales bacterium]|nr:L,D-transpeptidase [Eubacterium sp.]MDD7349317.1 L,D-transpeptidase [Clostridiales bacterium]